MKTLLKHLLRVLNGEKSSNAERDAMLRVRNVVGLVFISLIFFGVIARAILEIF